MYQLKFNIHSYWRAGTGRGGGALLDEMVHRDAYDLPCLPGRTVKGLLRDAVYQAEKWKHIPQGSTECWFGARDMEENRLENEAGALGVSDAVLDKALLDYLQWQKRQDAIGFQRLTQNFFHHIHATTIKPETGCAKDKSLRGMEVTIPLTLTAQLYELQPSILIDNWLKELEKCLPLIRAVGTSRSRGLGRVTLTLETNNEP